MPTEPQPPTLAEVVERAVTVTDLAGASEPVAELLRWFEDRDEPITAVADVDAALAEATTALDPEGDDPALTMARAVATYLAYRRDEVGGDRESILRLAARAELGDRPPEHVADWLRAQGIH